eukprot:TRINITY_DN40784_c0_g2_i1.p1 TRINITY_DN40784_c0_g2~~TRINITY_DN40784_c0_g2_i1.p1  ORF type:complete len:531 (+),score=64.16 TRINITY_DN40784_c0_g2_i1:61-1653(+)
MAGSALRGPGLSAGSQSLPDVIVADVGAAAGRFGFPGLPHPSHVLRHAEPQQQETPSGEEVLTRPYSYIDGEGLALNADSFEASLGAGLNRVPSSQVILASGQSILLAEPSQASAELRRKFAEVLFERLGITRAFLSRRATLGAYARGLTTALVLDIGASHSCCTAVVDGWVVPSRTVECVVAGDLIDTTLLARMGCAGPDKCVIAGCAHSFSLRTSPTSQLAIARAVKEATCGWPISDGGGGSGNSVGVVGGVGTRGCVTPEPLTSHNLTLFDNSRLISGDVGGSKPSLQLPDGTLLELQGHERALSEVPEQLLFGSSGVGCSAWSANGCVPPSSAMSASTRFRILRPFPVSSVGGGTSSGWLVGRVAAQPPELYEGLHLLVGNCLTRDHDGALVTRAAQRKLARSVVLIGGGSCLSGFPSRLRTVLLATKSWPSDAAAQMRVLEGGASTRLPLSALGADGAVRSASMNDSTATGTDTAASTCCRGGVVEHSSWTGGAIFASLGSFSGFQVTREEYEEVGATVFERKCP